MTNKERELSDSDIQKNTLEQKLKEKENEIKNLQKQYDESQQKEEKEKENNNVLKNKLK